MFKITIRIRRGASLHLYPFCFRLMEIVYRDGMMKWYRNMIPATVRRKMPVYEIQGAEPGQLYEVCRGRSEDMFCFLVTTAGMVEVSRREAMEIGKRKIKAEGTFRIEGKKKVMRCLEDGRKICSIPFLSEKCGFILPGKGYGGGPEFWMTPDAEFTSRRARGTTAAGYPNLEKLSGISIADSIRNGI